MALLDFGGSQTATAVSDLMEAHDGMRCDRKVIPVMDELRCSKASETVADITGDGDDASNLAFRSRALPVDVEHKVEDCFVEGVLLRAVLGTVVVHGRYLSCVTAPGSYRCRRGQMSFRTSSAIHRRGCALGARRRLDT